MGVVLAGRIAAVVTVASLGGANLFGRGSIRAAAVEPCGGLGVYSNLGFTPGTPGRTTA